MIVRPDGGYSEGHDKQAALRPSAERPIASCCCASLLEDFILDEASWHLGYLEVKAGEWLHSRSLLVPTRWVKSISWANRRVNLHHTREGV